MKIVRLLTIVGILMAAVLGILFVLDVLPSEELKKATGQIAAIIGIVSASGVLITFLNSSSRNRG